MTTPETMPETTPACIVSPRCFACRTLDRGVRRRAAVQAGSKFYTQAAVDAEVAFALALVESDHAAMRDRARRFPRRR